MAIKCKQKISAHLSENSKNNDKTNETNNNLMQEIVTDLQQFIAEISN